MVDPGKAPREGTPDLNLAEARVREWLREQTRLAHQRRRRARLRTLLIWLAVTAFFLTMVSAAWAPPHWWVNVR